MYPLVTGKVSKISQVRGSALSTVLVTTELLGKIYVRVYPGELKKLKIGSLVSVFYPRRIGKNWHAHGIALRTEQDLLLEHVFAYELPEMLIRLAERYPNLQLQGELPHWNKALINSAENVDSSLAILLAHLQESGNHPKSLARTILMMLMPDESPLRAQNGLSSRLPYAYTEDNAMHHGGKYFRFSLNDLFKNLVVPEENENGQVSEVINFTTDLVLELLKRFGDGIKSSYFDNFLQTADVLGDVAEYLILSHQIAIDTEADLLNLLRPFKHKTSAIERFLHTSRLVEILTDEEILPEIRAAFLQKANNLATGNELYLLLYEHAAGDMMNSLNDDLAKQLTVQMVEFLLRNSRLPYSVYGPVESVYQLTVSFHGPDYKDFRRLILDQLQVSQFEVFDTDIDGNIKEKHIGDLPSHAKYLHGMVAQEFPDHPILRLLSIKIDQYELILRVKAREARREQRRLERLFINLL